MFQGQPENLPRKRARLAKKRNLENMADAQEIILAQQEQIADLQEIIAAIIEGGE